MDQTAENKEPGNETLENFSLEMLMNRMGCSEWKQLITTKVLPSRDTARLINYDSLAMKKFLLFLLWRNDAPDSYSQIYKHHYKLSQDYVKPKWEDEEKALAELNCAFPKTDDETAELLTHMTGLQKLDMIHFIPKNEWMDRLPSTLKSLKMVIPQFNYTPRFANEFSLGLQLLQLQNLTELHFTSIPVSDVDVSRIARLPKLESLTIIGSRKLTGANLGFLPTTLKLLTLFDCVNLRYQRVEEAMMLLGNCGNLEHLEIWDCGSANPVRPIRSAFRYIVNQFTNLKVLRYYFDNLCEMNPSTIWMGADKLEELAIRPSFVSDPTTDPEPAKVKAYFYLTFHPALLPRLKKLFLSSFGKVTNFNLTHTMLQTCLNSCPALQEFELDYYTEPMTELVESLTDMPNLKRLFFTNVLINNVDIVTLVHRCSNLEELGIYCYHYSHLIKFDKRAINAVAEFCRLNPERKVKLSIRIGRFVKRLQGFGDIPSNLTLNIDGLKKPAPEKDGREDSTPNVDEPENSTPKMDGLENLTFNIDGAENLTLNIGGPENLTLNINGPENI